MNTGINTDDDKIKGCPLHTTLNDNVMCIISNQIEFDEKYERDKLINIGNGEVKLRSKDELLLDMHRYTTNLRLRDRINRTLKEWWKANPVKAAIISFIFLSLLSFAGVKIVNAFETIYDTNNKVNYMIDNQANLKTQIDTLTERQKFVFQKNNTQDSLLNKLIDKNYIDNNAQRIVDISKLKKEK
jgi:hypothetical protein